MGQAAGVKCADGSDCTLSGLLTPAALVSLENPWTHITGEKTCWSKGMHPSLPWQQDGGLGCPLKIAFPWVPAS